MGNPTAKTSSEKAARKTIALTAVPPAGPTPDSGAKSNSVAGSSVTRVTADARRAMIAEAAYYIAEERGFEQGHDMEHWLLAEKRIDAALNA